MGLIEILIIIFIIFFGINKIFISKKIFLDPQKKLKHKSFVRDKDEIPYSGGFLLLISCLFFLPFNSFLFKFYCSLIFFVGLMSDLEIVESPKKRIIFQGLILLSYLVISDTLVQSLRIELLDKFLEFYFIQLFFTLFCILILLNGSNFMDGVNTLASTYYIMILGTIIYVKYQFNLPENDLTIESIIFLTLVVFLFFNFFGKAYLGDSGVYLLSFIVGVKLIEFINNNNSFSPYFIACLLWYPAYENLFSIIRKKIKKISPSKADNYHLHQLLFIYIKKKLN